ncbi:MAG: hypothetical protein LBR73_05395 [Oscillospiraceae bacterium]|jgi:hypothetical protein|nr:hypothetical protein [Oscillospiraceae bacterium]
MKTLYLVSKVLTFPGAFLKGFWEHLICNLFEVPILQRGYLRDNWYCGHVEHAAPEGKKRFWVLFLPSFLNFVCGLPFVLAGGLPLFFFGVRPADTALFAFEVLFVYMGLCFWCNLGLAHQRQAAEG